MVCRWFDDPDGLTDGLPSSALVFVLAAEESSSIHVLPSQWPKAMRLQSTYEWLSGKAAAAQK